MKREANADEQRILNERPVLTGLALVCLEAWRKLDSQRYSGPVCPGPIPRLAVRDWARWERIDEDTAIVIADVLDDLDEKRARRITSELQLKKGRT